MTERANTCDTSNTCGDDFVALRGRLEESLVNGCADWDPEWASDPDNPTLTFAQRLAQAGHFSEDNLDQHQLTSHPMQCLCEECCPPTNDSFYAGTIGNRKIISPDTRPYNLTLKNISPRIVSAVIGKKGAVQKELVRQFYLKSLHIGDPEDQVIDSGRTVSRCNIVLIGYNRENLIAASKKIVTILKQEEELYIEVDYMDYRTQQRAFI